MTSFVELLGAKREGDATQTFELNGNKYSSYIDSSTGIFYFFDTSMGNRQLGGCSLFASSYWDYFHRQL